MYFIVMLSTMFSHIAHFLTKFHGGCMSVVYMESKCEVVFSGQVVIHTDICAMNGKHRPYKQHAANAKELDLVFNQVAQDIPKIY